MRKVLSFVLCICLMIGLAASVTAASPKIVDNADLLTPSEEAALEQKANDLVDRYKMDVVIVTVNWLDGKTSEAYADDYFDYNGYGIGDDFSGILLLISMGEREWAISTCGEAIYAFTDYGIEKLFGSFSAYLSGGDYYRAFDKYLTQLPKYFDAYERHDPIDGVSGGYDGPGTVDPPSSDDKVYYDEPLTLMDIAFRCLISLAIGAAAGLIGIGIMATSMKTAKKQTAADDYLVDDSYKLISRQDIFLYSKTSRQRKSEGGSSGGGGGRSGGSSVHRSSSGRTHGGRSGRF